MKPIGNKSGYFQRFQNLAMNRMAPGVVLDKDSLTYWRVRILFAIILTGLLIGLFVFVPSAVLVINKKLWGLLLFDVVSWPIGIGLLLSRRLKYEIRAAVALIFFYALGLAIIISVGPLSGGPIWLFAFAVLVGVLLGAKAAIIALTVNAITLTITSLLISTGVMGHTFPFFRTMEAMITAGANFILLNTIAAVSVAVLVKGLISTHQKKEALYSTLGKERFHLIEAKKKLEHEVEERKQAEVALRKSEQDARQYFNVASVGFVALDKKGNITLINKRGLEILGYRQEELIGRNWFETCLPDKSRKDVSDVFHKLIRGEIKPGEDYENVVLTKEGEERIVFWHNAILRNRSGEITGTLSSGKDITEQIQAEQEKKKLEAHLQKAQKMESIGTLAGGIAHDFNNILFPIFGYLEMLLEDVSEDDPLRGRIEEVFNGAKRARDLVQQILTFSRQKDHELKPLNVHLVIIEALKLIKSSLPSTIEINQNIKSDCGLVFADPSQIHQIVMNLCTNAFHAMEATGGKLTVNLKEVELAVEDLKDPSMISGKHVCLTVIDNGIGMEQSIVDRMFDPYFTTKEEGKGTGLGLAVVHGIVKSHGGHISVYSEPGKGTEFKVHLPVIKKQEETAKAKTDTLIKKGDERILIVDDEDMIVQMEKQMLERLGYHVTPRTSSSDALELFRKQPAQFDVVITDMTMPNMTGEQLAAEIINIRSDIPIILCTGFSEMMSEERAESLGITGFLMKPVVIKDLAEMIRKVLDSK